MRAKSVLSIAAQTERLPMPKRPVSAEIVTILAPGEAPLPQRRSGAAQARAVQLVELLQELTSEAASLVELNLQQRNEARATASIIAHSADPYSRPRHSAPRAGTGTPAATQPRVA